MPRLRVLISGAGISGNSLAYWLSRLGHDVTVVERSPSLRTAGLQLDLRDHAINVMKRMGLEEAFRSKAAPEQGMQIVDKSGRRRAYFPANKSGNGGQSFTTDFEIMRGDLCRIIYDSTKSRVKYVFEESIESFEEKAESIEIRFEDGKTDQFDLLVGADGQNSRTRKMMLGPEMADTVFHPLGSQYIAYFTIPRPVKEGEKYIATMYMALGKRGIMTRRHSPNECQVYIGGSNPSERLKNARRGDIQEEKEAIAEIFEDAGWQSEDIVKAMMDSDNFYCEHLGLVKMESWSKGRVVLVGDAAYCPSATTGKGTTCALVGAYILAGEIGKHCGSANRGNSDGVDIKHGLTKALEAYEKKFQPYMKQVQEGVSESEDKESVWDKFSSKALGVNTINYFLGVASLLKVDVVKMFLKGGDVKGWNLPIYEEMRRG